MKVNTPEKIGKAPEGFERPTEGWHKFIFEEGIAPLKKKDASGNEIDAKNEKTGDPLIKFPTIIEDEHDEQNGLKYDIIIMANDRGETQLVNYIGAANAPFWDKMVKAFPDEVSVFAKEYIKNGKTVEGPWAKVVTNLPKSPVWFKIVHKKNTKNPDNPYVNISAWGPITKTVEELEKELYPDKGSGKGTGAGAGKQAEKEPPEPEEEF